MDKKDMELLIEAEDAINNMDRVLVQLTSISTRLNLAVEK